MDKYPLGILSYKKLPEDFNRSVLNIYYEFPEEYFSINYKELGYDDLDKIFSFYRKKYNKYRNNEIYQNYHIFYFIAYIEYYYPHIININYDEIINDDKYDYQIKFISHMYKYFKEEHKYIDTCFRYFDKPASFIIDIIKKKMMLKIK